jgi:His-Xaa-Ser system protein HxsD
MATPPETTLTSSFAFRDGSIRVTVDLGVYRLTAIKKAAYRFADRFTAVLGAPDQQALPLELIFRPGTSAAAASEATRMFFEELLDQELREQVGDETRAVRSLIIAQAFSRTDLIKRE